LSISSSRATHVRLPIAKSICMAPVGLTLRLFLPMSYECSPPTRTYRATS
jgi:hypothetical protein